MSSSPNPLSVRKSIVRSTPGAARRVPVLAPAFTGHEAVAEPAVARGHHLDPLVREWLLELKVGGRSPRTIQWYECHFRTFRARGGAATLEELTGQHVKLYLSELQERGLADTSVRGVFLTLKCFANWAAREGYPVEPALLRLRTPRVAVKEMVTYSPEQLATIDSATPAGWPKLAVRLLLGTGIRISELCDLRSDDIEDDGDQVFLKVRRGKGAKFRRVPVSQRLRRDLTRFMNRERPDGARDLILAIFRLAVADYLGQAYGHDGAGRPRSVRPRHRAGAELFLRGPWAVCLGDWINLSPGVVWQRAQLMARETAAPASRPSSVSPSPERSILHPEVAA